MSYDPRISHYRRAHAPRRLYLPPELSIAAMHKNYLGTGGKCSYELYQREVALKNISFAALGKEECETCLYKEHVCNNKDRVDVNVASAVNATINCDICKLHEVHIGRATATRITYKVDSAKVNCNKEAFFSVDLQKVIMLPRLPGVKTVAFTRHIIVYETLCTFRRQNIFTGEDNHPLCYHLA